LYTSPLKTASNGLEVPETDNKAQVLIQRERLNEAARRYRDAIVRTPNIIKKSRTKQDKMKSETDAEMSRRLSKFIIHTIRNMRSNNIQKRF